MWYLSDEGPSGFVMGGPFPRFLEVRFLNDRILLYVEAEALRMRLFIESWENSDQALYDTADLMRIQNNIEWNQIWDSVQDLKASFGIY